MKNNNLLLAVVIGGIAGGIIGFIKSRNKKQEDYFAAKNDEWCEKFMKDINEEMLKDFKKKWNIEEL